MPTTVGLLANFEMPTIRHLTPGGTGWWDDVRFVTNPTEPCDYIIVRNRPSVRSEVICPPEHVWAIMQEPPNEVWRHWHNSFPVVKRVYTQDESKQGSRFRHSHPALPWHVGRSYDDLKSGPPPEKTKDLSWITSNRRDTIGHQHRMKFLERLQQKLDFDLYGRGFMPIEDKWDGIAPYRYSIAVENFSNPYYWTEKLADCYLAWAMPIYYGCTRIHTYFPPESMVLIDINDPDAAQRVQEAVHSDLRERNLDAIAEARRRILDEYQLLPFLVKEIRAHERTPHSQPDIPRRLVIPARTPLKDAIQWRLRNLLEQLRRSLSSMSNA
jgi:hypothetical protein